MKVTLILACAGKGTRAGYTENKLWQKIDGEYIISRSLLTFKESGLIDQYVITANEEDYDRISDLYGKDCIIVKGGATRTESVTNALTKVDGDIVLIHDGARPFVTNKMIKDCIDTASKYGGAIPVVPSRDTVVKVCEEKVCDYLGKNSLYSVQTPQGFKTNLIKNAYARAGARAYNDDGEVYKEFVGELYTYMGDYKNVKLTYAEDFENSSKKLEYRFGVGFDCHKLVENRALVLGGVTIPHDKGLLGHSDADVLTHAIMDAILSAYANRDIGYHFSDKDPKYKGACSMDLLNQVLEMTKNAGYKVDSVSASVMAEKPKLLKHIPTITESLASAMDLPVDRVGITATTLEGLGFVGREEGICTHATATLVKL
ncbi:MAG: 2-C-methyl-D-erythritol 2,4-cyclodiphosphate synthase [Clostridia bacterium]|nr:2-C-methyl-D-erythritol 2,4-cyclodiphosphate synthase [Clostridia bacterium]